MDREFERFIHRRFEQFGRKLRNIVARGIVQMVDDGSKMQTTQIGLLDGEIFDGAERAQQYGFSSHPLPGAECFVVFCGSAREHPVIVSVDDRRHRQRDSKPGEVVIYTDEGDSIHFKRGNIIEVTTKGDVIVKAGRSIDATAGTSITAKAGAEIAATAGTSIAATAGTTVSVTAKTAIALTAPNIYLNGNISASSDSDVAIKVKTFSVYADKVDMNEGV
jgi:phage baseplate assembly protein V